MSKKIVFTLFLSSFIAYGCETDLCIGSNLAFFTTQGICVFNDAENAYTKEEIEYVIDITEQEIIKKYKTIDRYDVTLDLVREKYVDTSIHIIPRSEAVLGDYQAKVTWKFGTYTIRIAPYECLSSAALHHEILHVIYIGLFGHSGGTGSDLQAHPEGWFKRNEYSDEYNLKSLEYIIYVRLLNELCT